MSIISITSKLNDDQDNGLLIFNGFKTLIDSNETEPSGSYIDLINGKSGICELIGGDALVYTRFIFTTTGIVTLKEDSGNVFTSLQTGTNHLIIKDNGTNVRITNELGASYNFNITIKYNS